MKKYFLAILCVGFFGMSFAQDTNISWNVAQNIVKPGEIKIITQDLWSDNMTDLQNIQSRFCDDNKVTKDLKMVIRPWQRKEICIAFANKSDKSVDISFWFSEGIFGEKWPTCLLDMSTTNDFSKHIIHNTLTGITIPASGTVIEKFTYLAPRSASGNIFGCFGYQINQPETIKEGNMFLIVPRKVWYIYINILWSVYNFWRRDDMKDVYVSNKAMILKVLIGILAVWLIISIAQTSKKNKKEQTNTKKENKETKEQPIHHKKK